ncbi:hypothetical protein LJD17_17045 [Microvirga rosea]|nr:hypothetical protein [Microvirga rosea]
MESKPKAQQAHRLWQVSLAAYQGAKLGLLITLAHHLYHAMHGVTPGEEIVAHRLLELVGFTVGGSIGLAAIAVLYNCFVQARSC